MKERKFEMIFFFLFSFPNLGNALLKVMKQCMIQARKEDDGYEKGSSCCGTGI